MIVIISGPLLDEYVPLDANLFIGVSSQRLIWAVSGEVPVCGTLPYDNAGIRVVAVM